MRLTTTTCGLAFLSSTLIVAAVSLPQSSSLPQSTSLPLSASSLKDAAFSARLHPTPPNWTPPANCVGIGAHELSDDDAKRDLQSSENNNAALQPRTSTSYACGKLTTGFQSDTFQFYSTAPVMLAWNTPPAYPGDTREEVWLMKVNPNGKDTVVGGVTGIFNWRSPGFAPAIGSLYYVHLRALPHCLITWWIAPLA